MKPIILIFLIMFSAEVSAVSKVLAPFREGTSNYTDSKQADRAVKYFRNDVLEVIEGAKTELDRNMTGTLEDIVTGFSHLPGVSSRRNVRESVAQVLVLCREERIIDDILYRLLRDTSEKMYPTDTEEENGRVNPGAAMTLADYLRKKESILKIAAVTAEPETNPFPKKNFSFTVGQYRDLSAQEMLFYSYQVGQMRAMAKILAFTLNVADAESVVTTVNFRDHSEPLVITHSATDQYRLAVRLMKQKKTEAETNPLLIGRPVKNIDLILSAYYIGVVSYDEISLVVQDPNFYRPEISMEKKVLKYVGNLALLGLKLYPVTAPYVVIPLIIYNAFAESKKMKQTVDEDSFIFTLPGDQK